MTPLQNSTKRLQKNCMECTYAHRKCVFLLMDDVKCTQCNKFNLSCQFRFSGMFIICLLYQLSKQFALTHQLILFSFLLISEQGRRNDIKIRTSIIQSSNDPCIVPPPLDVSSESVHCNALTQSSTVSYAFSCHIIDTCGEKQDVESALALPPPHSHS
jgi:hypothetical protein